MLNYVSIDKLFMYNILTKKIYILVYILEMWYTHHYMNYVVMIH